MVGEPTGALGVGKLSDTLGGSFSVGSEYSRSLIFDFLFGVLEQRQWYGQERDALGIGRQFVGFPGFEAGIVWQINQAGHGKAAGDGQVVVSLGSGHDLDFGRNFWLGLRFGRVLETLASLLQQVLGARLRSLDRLRFVETCLSVGADQGAEFLVGVQGAAFALECGGVPGKGV